jgi:predicted P-loop ATPase
MGEGKFMQVDQRVLNTLCIDARSQGVNCWDKDVSRLLHSQKMIDFHPFLTFMAELPEWDGIDRVSELAKRISDKPLWVNGFHRWMLAMAAQWMNLGGQCANAVAPLLVSTQQGRCKSTFCSILLPEELQKFYIDKFDLTSESGCEQKLSLFGLVNMDEFDRYSVRSMATLKNLMQLKKLNFRKSHRSYYSQLPRIASFIGTSNQKELLTDTTGSRRFLCVEVKEKIDCTRPDYDQLYAQLKAELLAGERYWFTSEEEQDIQQNNKMFYKHSPEEDVFFRCFRLPEEGEEGVLLSPTEIFCRLQKRFPAAFRGSNASRMGKVLTALGVERIRTKYGTSYRVIPVVLS